MVQVTCFVGDIHQVDSARAAVASAFPGAAANFVQLTRLAVEPGTSCEGVGRLQKPGNSPPKLVFTAAQMAFGDQEQALRLAYGRLGRALQTMKASYADAQVMSVYSLSRPAADKAAALAPEFLGGCPSRGLDANRGRTTFPGCDRGDRAGGRSPLTPYLVTVTFY